MDTIAELRAENERLQEAKRAALKVADERSKENVALRAALTALKSDGVTALYRQALEIIAERKQCIDSLMSNTEIANEALERADAMIADQRDET